MAFVVKHFKKKPSRDELKDLYEKFKSKNGSLKLKVGICLERNLKGRYSETGRYKVLKDWNVFCKSSDSVARLIEEDMKHILFDDDKCVNSYSDKDASKSYKMDKDQDETMCVYMVELKSDLYYCTLCVKFVGEKAQVESHMESHPFYRSYKKIQQNVKKEGLNVSLNVEMEPVKYFLRTWKSTTCQFCGVKFPDPREPNRHYRRCQLNPSPPFKCHICSHFAYKFDELERHLLSHDHVKAREERNFKYLCPHPGCGQSFDDVSNKNRHAKYACTKRPVVKRFVCDICGKSYTRNDSLDRHKKALHPN